MRLAVLGFLILFCGSLRGQELQMDPIETFPLDATLIAPLQGSNDRGIIRIERIKPNPYNIEAGDTLLAQFYFGFKPVKNERDLIGIEAGEMISARLAARRNSLDGAYYYQVFHYKNISRMKAAKRQESLSSDEPQK